MQIRLTTDETVPVAQGESVQDALKHAGIDLVSSCGGKGTCGKCKVRIVQGDYRESGNARLTVQERGSGLVLACRTFPVGDLVVEIPKVSRLVVGDKIAVSRMRELAAYMRSYGVTSSPLTSRLDIELPPPTLTDSISDLERLKRELSKHGFGGVRFSHRFAETMPAVLRGSAWNVSLTYIEGDGIRDEALFLSPQDDAAQRYGIAVDVGTTTLVLYLVRLLDGEVIDIASTYNSQMQYGDDVISRIVYATEQAGAERGLAELQDAVVSDINALAATLCGRHAVDAAVIDAVVLAGNTTMSHIFWRLDPSSIREEPYIPALNYFPLWKAGTQRIAVNPQAPVYTLPCVASYVGGDIVAGVLAAKMHRRSEITLLMDIGTNGELVVGNNEWLVTAACSAGP
ncbi:MAG TPA: 2Fe-2S iron-sulfur cluster-binding protein, partial [Dissulfurispiraceae bacterium]|nr:2Fe-2S iron-sulfur cluster-binding protein [Dissulfurispiraceae bacterium]